MEDASADNGQKARLEEYRKKALLEAQKKMFLKQALDGRAYDRMMNIRLASPELYDQVFSLLSYLKQGGQLNGVVSEEKLLALVGRLTERKETKIQFSRK